MKKYLLIAMIIAVALPCLALAAFTPATLTNGVKRVAVFTQEQAAKLFGQGYVLEDKNLGAYPGSEFNQAVILNGGIMRKTLASTTSATATTLNVADLAKYQYISLVPNAASFTYTLPASSTMMSLFPAPGVERVWYILNATSTSGITITVAKGTGWDLTGVDANVDVLAAGSYGKMTCIKQPTRDIFCGMEEYVAAD